MLFVTRDTVLGERVQFVMRDDRSVCSENCELDFVSTVIALARHMHPSNDVNVEWGLDRDAWEDVWRGKAIPHTLQELLSAGESWWHLALHTEERALQLLTREERATCMVSGTVQAVLPRPLSLRDFYAFEAHVMRARARRGLTMVPEWYQLPVFYFSNPLCVVGDTQTVMVPRSTRCLDYELEAAIIVRRTVRDTAPQDLLAVTAGLTIFNDWSARDVQREEVKVGLGPAKGKDFASSLGPALLTWDELVHCLYERQDARGPRVRLSMRAFVNGELLSEGNLDDLHFTLGELVARASQDVTLYPGEVIGTGTVGSGCLLERGEEVHDWLQAGDEVVLEIERIGRLRNCIAKEE